MIRTVKGRGEVSDRNSELQGKRLFAAIFAAAPAYSLQGNRFSLYQQEILLITIFLLIS